MNHPITSAGLLLFPARCQMPNRQNALQCSAGPLLRLTRALGARTSGAACPGAVAHCFIQPKGGRFTHSPVMLRHNRAGPANHSEAADAS